MTDLRAGIFASVQERQAGTSAEVGDVYIRDGAALLVTGRSEGVLGWRTAEGLDLVAPERDFLARAVDLVPAGGSPATYLDNVWQLASSANIPRDVRALAVQRAARRAVGEVDRLTVRRWASTLSAGMEPTR